MSHKISTKTLLDNLNGARNKKFKDKLTRRYQHLNNS